ncbi:MAG: hypothetical protein CMJ82_02960 [Planctomycetaceae bacterium]|nr:hypothetical protein [Planctomycetaceae bacterium]
MAASSAKTSRRFAHTQWGAARHKAVFILACTMLVEVILQLIPAFQSVMASWNATEESQLNRWVYYMLLAGIMQIGFLFYMLLFPDWATLWAATLGNLLFIAAYAGLFAILILTKGQNDVLSYLQLDLEQSPTGKQAMWCLVCMFMLIAQSFFAGRYARRWKRDK